MDTISKPAQLDPMDPNQNHISSHLPGQSLATIIVRSAGMFGILIVASAIGTALISDTHRPPEQGVSIHPVAYQSDLQPDQKPDEKPDPGDGIQECILTLVSGRRITGELVRQDALVVVIGINGIETTFQSEKVSSLTLLPPVATRYQIMRDAIADDDIDARLTLVEWLRIRKAYALALSELDSILRIDPTNPQAKLLHTWLSAHDKLGARKKKKSDAKGGTPTDSSKKARRSRRPQRNTVVALTPEQINLMRVYEIDLQNPPKLRVPDATLRTLMLRVPDAFPANENDREAIYRLPEVEKLKLIFTHKARDLYSQVVVLEDPESLRKFKQEVHSQRGWLINTCASTRCHGGTDAGPFELINMHPNSNATVYTNLYTIEHFMLKNGSSLIDFDSPERSPLLQMAMNQKTSLYPHPAIPKGYRGSGFRPIFRSTRDRKYRDAVEWIRSMYQPRPDYDFDDPTQPEPNQPPADPKHKSRPDPAPPGP